MSFVTRTSLLSIPCSLLVTAGAASAQVSYSVDWHGPTVGVLDTATTTPITEGDILTTTTGVPAFGPLPAPSIAITGGGLGLGLAGHPGCVGHPGGTPCVVEVDALSFGIDRAFQPNQPILPGQINFSTDEFAVGIPVGPGAPDLLTEAPVGDASSDVWTTVLFGPPAPLPPFAGPLGHTGVIDGDGLVSGSGALYAGLGLIEPNFPGVPPDTGDNLDAFDWGGSGNLAGIFFSLDYAMPDPRTGVPNTGSAGFHGFSGADILITPFPGGVPAVWAPAFLLGLDIAGPDDLDALVVSENFVPGFQPAMQPFDWFISGTDMVLFSVRTGSAVIGMPDSMFGIPIEPGDILAPPLPTFMGGVSPFPSMFIAAENLGLATMRSGAPIGDDLNALDVLGQPINDCNSNGFEDAADVASGTSTDVDGNGIPDECEATVIPFCFCTSGAPCGNVFGTAGCLNSTGTGGLLTTTGTTSVGLDDLVLVASGLPTTAFNLFFQGSVPVAAVPFGDGQRCIGGPFVRLQIAPASGGVSTFGPGLAGTYGYVPGQTIYMQNWYRDPSGPCASTFNLTNALRIRFTP